MKIKKKYFNTEFLLIRLILFLISLKLIFSYLNVENSYWLRHLPLNVDQFNPLNLPANFSGRLEYIIIPLMFLYVFKNFRRLGKFKLTLFIGFFMLALNVCTSFYKGLSVIESINYTLKLFSPILFFICLVVHSKKNDVDLKKIMLRIFKLCLLLTIIALLFFNISMNRVVEQWPIYFSSIHTHSYVLVSICIGFSYLIFKNKNTYYLLFFILISFLILFFGYAVRTVLIVYLIYITSILYAKNKFFKYLWLQFLVILPMVLLIGLFAIQSLDMNRFSSGRLDMYSEKFNMLKTYSVPEYLFGRGAGADLIRTETWWYDEKGSHNDFITLTIENGFIYLFLFVFIMITIIPYYKKINLIYLSLIISYFFSSLISNGIAVRPISGYIFFMVLAYIYMDIVRNKTIINE